MFNLIWHRGKFQYTVNVIKCEILTKKIKNQNNIAPYFFLKLVQIRNVSKEIYYQSAIKQKAWINFFLLNRFLELLKSKF